jgi:hypothetical protein
MRIFNINKAKVLMEFDFILLDIFLSSPKNKYYFLPTMAPENIISTFIRF